MLEKIIQIRIICICGTISVVDKDKFNEYFWLQDRVEAVHVGAD